MFEPTRYLQWARRYYGKVRFDLATSGMPTVPLAALGMPAPEQFDDPSGFARLRDAIAKYNAVPAHDAIATLGTTHALWLAYASLTAPGDEVLVEDPGYEPLIRLAEGVGARVTRFARDPRARFALDPESIARKLTPHTRLVVVTNLHNPSGVRAPDEVLRAVAQVTRAHGAHLLVDEVYAPLDGLTSDLGVFEGSARRLAPSVVTVSSLTKCYGMGPERIGWLLGPSEVVARAEDTMMASCGSLPLAHAHVGLRAFDRIGFLAERARATLIGKRARVEAWVDSLGLAWSAPEEGLFAFVTIPEASDLTPTIEAAARDREILVAAGSFFGIPNGFRIAWSAPTDVLDEGLARLADVIDSVRGKRIRFPLASKHSNKT